MAPTIEEMEAMSDEEVRRLYNEIAQHTSPGLEWYREELHRRSIDRQTTTLVQLASAILWLTVANAGLVLVTLAVTLYD